MEFIRQTLIARDALGLLLVVLAEMRMLDTSEIAIDPAMLTEVGNPSKRMSARLLRPIGELPEGLCTLLARKDGCIISKREQTGLFHPRRRKKFGVWSRPSKNKEYRVKLGT